MEHRRILIIEDDPDIAELLQYNLEREQFKTLWASSGEEGFRLAQEHPVALVLLDLVLPGVQGLDVCRMLKGAEATRAIPLIIVTSRDQESDIVVGLELGADDYITKPFGIREMIARIRSVLRRSTSLGEEPSELEAGPLKLDLDGYRAFLEGRPMELTQTEFRLLRGLLRQRGRVLTRDRLVQEMTDGKTFIVDRNVDVHIRSIRKKLGKHAQLISTVRGVGYRILEED